jgi:hypothetical protein
MRIPPPALVTIVQRPDRKSKIVTGLVCKLADFRENNFVLGNVLSYAKEDPSRLSQSGFVIMGKQIDESRVMSMFGARM